MSAAPDGPLLAGRYRFVRERGRGAAGRVVEVRDEADEAWVLKLVPPGFRASLVAEFDALAQLRHGSLPRVRELLRVDDAVPAPFSVEPGTLALVEALVEGEEPFHALAVLALDDPTRWLRVAEIGAHVAGALRAVHARVLVHGDVKPENLRVGPSGAFLLDLGLVGVGSAVAGTPGYLARRCCSVSASRRATSTPSA